MKSSIILLILLGFTSSVHAESLQSEDHDLEEQFSNACERFGGDSTKLFAFKLEEKVKFLYSEHDPLIKTRAVVEFEITPGAEVELIKVPEVERSEFSSRIEYRQALIDRQTRVAMIKYGASVELLEELDLKVRFGPLTERAIITGDFGKICEATKIATIQEIVLEGVFSADFE